MTLTQKTVSPVDGRVYLERPYAKPAEIERQHVVPGGTQHRSEVIVDLAICIALV